MDSNIMEKIDSHTNIDQNVKDMTDAITKAAEDSIPNKTVTIRPNDPPWITSHIRLLILKRKLTYRKFKKSKQNHHWTKYKTLRNTVISELRKSKQEYFEKLDRELSSDDCNSKTFWKTSKQIFNNDKTSTSVPPLKIKAFDRVWHKGLLFKLRTIGCSDSIINWFLSYLSNRRQRVVINGQASDWASVLAGVPQGSILGPLLFLIFINDIVKHIGCSIRLFADDTSLYIIVDCPLQAGQLLNRDLDAISTWANNWLVTFNPSKTLSMLISRKRNSVFHPPISMDGVIIGKIPSHKHLGLTFLKTCSWDEHIVNISEKACTRVNLLKALKFRVSRKSLEKMYFAYVRPLLEYSDTVWDNCSLASKKLLDAVHIEAARIVSGGTKLCSVDKLFQELGWEPLQIRRNKHKLVTFYKILHGLTPTYLLDIIPPHINETIDYPLRNADHFQNFRANSNLFHESFFPSTIRAWNNLPNEIKESTSVSAFKVQLNKNLPKPPKYFNVGSRLGQVLQARLRMECSALNADLYRKNIVNSPSCQCGGFENAQHLFFTCPLYAESRRNLSIRLDNYSINQLLYGIEDSTLQENTTLFIEVQNFLTSCGRFNQRREPNQARAH